MSDRQTESMLVPDVVCFGMITPALVIVAAASLKCTVLGPRAFPVEDITKLAAGLRMEHF